MAVPKTTVYLEALARVKGRTTTELVRDAVAEYTVKEQPRRVKTAGAPDRWPRDFRA